MHSTPKSGKMSKMWSYRRNPLRFKKHRHITAPRCVFSLLPTQITERTISPWKREKKRFFGVLSVVAIVVWDLFVLRHTGEVLFLRVSKIEYVVLSWWTGRGNDDIAHKFSHSLAPADNHGWVPVNQKALPSPFRCLVGAFSVTHNLRSPTVELEADT